MQPLTVTAHLAFGICQGRPWGLALDGLLASVLWHDHKATTGARYTPAQTPADLDLPLDRCTAADGQWHWAATFAHTTPVDPDPDVRMRYLATDRDDLTRLAGTLPTTVSDHQGRYRRRQTPAIALVTPTATWQAVGDIDAITELLAGIHRIGKHRGGGEGEVSRWTVTPSGRDWWSAGHESIPGVLGRTALPGCLTAHPDTACGPRERTGLRPPYLHPSRRGDAVLPAG